MTHFSQVDRLHTNNLLSSTVQILKPTCSQMNSETMVDAPNDYIKTKKNFIQVFTFKRHLKIDYLLSVLEQTMCGIEFHSLWS